jgi:hypothetical protein
MPESGRLPLLRSFPRKRESSFLEELGPRFRGDERETLAFFAAGFVVFLFFVFLAMPDFPCRRSVPAYRLSGLMMSRKDGPP